jgi:hypothetical protein
MLREAGAIMSLSIEPVTQNKRALKKIGSYVIHSSVM